MTVRFGYKVLKQRVEVVMVRMWVITMCECIVQIVQYYTTLIKH